MKKLPIVALAFSLVLLLAMGAESLPGMLRSDVESFRRDIGQPDQGRAIRLVRCWFSDGWLQRSDCGWLYPAEQGASPAALPLVILRSGLLQRSNAATIYLSGGPGGSSYLHDEAMPYWRSWIQRLGLDHDLVLYDQRGSGFAVPSLGCRSADIEDLQQIVAGDSIERGWAGFVPLMEACAAAVPSLDRRAGLYSTATAAMDLRELVRALRDDLGYTEVRLYGVSYGSRLAQVALSEPLPEVSRAVLDGFYPAGIDLSARFADDFARILDAMDDACGRHTDCAPAPTGLRDVLGAAMRKLGDAGAVVMFSEPLELDGFPRDGEPLREVRVTAATVLTVLEHELTAGKNYEDVRSMLEQARDGDFDGVWPMVLREWLWLLDDPDFSSLAQALIECRDNPPTRPDLQAAMLARYPQWRNALLLPEIAYAFCDRIGVSPAPLRASVIEQPVLLLAAAFDPRTPTAPALEAARSFPQLSQLVLPRSGHGMADLDACGARYAGRFLNEGFAPSANACE